jgi:heat shock protein HslJ
MALNTTFFRIFVVDRIRFTLCKIFFAMNISRFIIPCLVISVVPLSSCSLYNSIFEKKATQEAVIPQDREQIRTDRATKTYNLKELAYGSIEGDWAIETVSGKNAIGETTPYLKFVNDGNRVYGNNGCNALNASYSYTPADSTLSFSDVITTMRMCGKEGITDYEITSALNHTSYYSWHQDNSQYFLTFYDSTHRELMTLMHQDFQFLNGTWRVVAIEEEPISVPDMKLVIDVDEGKLHGNTGCNIINGTLETNMNAVNSISFQSIVMTTALCNDSEYETPFVVALEEACTARPISSSKVLLLDSQGKVVLELIRTTDN